MLSGLRAHAPLVVLAIVSAVLFYLLFRDLRSVHAGLDALAASQQAQQALLMSPPLPPHLAPGAPAAADAAASPAAPAKSSQQLHGEEGPADEEERG